MRNELAEGNRSILVVILKKKWKKNLKERTNHIIFK